MTNKKNKRFLMTFLTAIITLTALESAIIIPVSAQTGTVLATFVPGGATGNGRGMAFDGTNLYYTIVGDSNIYKIDTSGNLLATISVPAGDPRNSTGGPLAWDGSALWTMNYVSNSFILYRVSPTSGATLSFCNIATQNPAHPAVTSSPRNIGEFPDGLAWTGSTLWASSEIFPGNWVAEVDTNCNILSAFNPPANLGVQPLGAGGTSGIAFDGVNLWHVTRNSTIDMLIFQTDTSNVTTGLNFTTGNRLIEDLAYDPVTFAPKCVLWGNEATGGPNHITAYEIPCGVISVDIDIKPGSFPNSINTKSRGKIPVAILSSPSFDAVNSVDRTSLTFGRTGNENSLAFCNKSPEDVNGDGFLDLVCHFRTQDTGFQQGDTEGILRGQTINGSPIEGKDSVRIVK